jgi:NADH pyrophosphatase NudC (nudix superfamily)
MQVTPECICEVKKDYLLYTHFCPLCGKPNKRPRKNGYEYDCDEYLYYVCTKIPFDELKEIKTISELTNYCFKIASQMKGFLQHFPFINSEKGYI